MGGEFGQWREWTETESLDWHLLDEPLHGGVQRLVRDLNRVYGPERALWEADSDTAGFEWIDVDNALENIVAFTRRSPQYNRDLICVCNFSAVPKQGYRVPQLADGQYELIINTDSEIYGGAATVSVNGPDIDLPPLTTLWFVTQKSTKQKRPQKSTKGAKKKSTGSK
jgi:1,4-alpha-glucan branching enzyme